MNLAFFLVPKSDVVWVPTHATVGRAIRELETSGYAALPLLDEEGRYAGTITEGDLLRALLRARGQDPTLTDRTPLADVPLRSPATPVGIDAQMEELFSRVAEQNFVPVVDSRGVFVGIVRRREILEFCARTLSTTRRAESRK